MARVKIQMPVKFDFRTEIPIRITDINYGGHVGNDTILSLIQEARTEFLSRSGFTEIDFGGAGLIMSDAAIEFKSELFYGDRVSISIAVMEFSKVAFEFYYQLEKPGENSTMKIVALAKTGMVCFDYSAKKVIPIPETALKKMMKNQS